MFKDFHGALTHLNGLTEIIRQNGGLASLGGNPVARILLFW